MEKNMMDRSPSPIVAVAAFNIITSVGSDGHGEAGRSGAIFTNLRADAATNYDGLYGAGRQRRDYRRAVGRRAGRIACRAN